MAFARVSSIRAWVGILLGKTLLSCARGVGEEEQKACVMVDDVVGALEVRGADSSGNTAVVFVVLVQNQVPKHTPSGYDRDTHRSNLSALSPLEKGKASIYQ